MISELADRLGGVTTGTVQAWLSPSVAARRARYAGWCIDCGGATSGSNGPARALRCDGCQRAWQTASGWTRAKIIAAFHRWAAEHEGVHPSADAWKSASARSGDYPGDRTVERVFGSRAAALRAAGVEPFEAGASREVRQEIRRRYEAGESTNQLARAYGCSVPSISHSVRAAGGTVRSRNEAQAVRQERGRAAAQQQLLAKSADR